MGWLYGYYSEDPNFPEGVRVNVEAVYEPRQVGEMSGVEPLEDPMQNMADMIAEGLTLEKVGWIFTSVNNDTFLTSQDVRKVAKYQDQYKVDHPEGYKVSKFVTIVVKPRGDGAEIGIDSYMVSDVCQALERDNVFGESESRKKMVLREAGPKEMIPSVVKEGKPAKEFEPDFFIVSLGHGQPKTKKEYNILKNYDFPLYNRGKTNPTKRDFQDFLKRHKGEPS
jgi:nuclear protein localization family protein 4